MASWIEANSLNSLPEGKKNINKWTNQLVAGKTISVQIDFSAAKTSTERY